MFELEKDKKCLYDYFEVFEGNTTDEEHRLGNRLCGNRSLDRREFESKGRKMSILFNSDRSVTFKGFHAEWKTQKISKLIFNVPQHNCMFESWTYTVVKIQTIKHTTKTAYIWNITFLPSKKLFFFLTVLEIVWRWCLWRSRYLIIDLKQLRRQEQGERQKTVGLFEQNNNCARASCFWVFLFNVHCTNTAWN